MRSESRRRRLVRAVDRALIGTLMAVLAFALDRRLRKALRTEKEEKRGVEVG